MPPPEWEPHHASTTHPIQPRVSEPTTISTGTLILALRLPILGIILSTALRAEPQEPPKPPPALRAAVPLLCTEIASPFRTHVRGTGVFVDSAGTLLTAAHVILEAHSGCTLSVMIPDDEWLRTSHLRRFLLGRCHLNEYLDLALCLVSPADNQRDRAYLRGALLRIGSAVPGEPVWVTGFTGWVLAPLVRVGHITGREDYRRPDGCRCDFATDIVAVEGMSGSPILSSSGAVVGILTQAGKGKFRGLSFGITISDARAFLSAEGVVPPRP